MKVTDEHREFALEYVRTSGWPVNLSVAVSELTRLSRAPNWPSGTNRQWERAIADLVLNGQLSHSGDRIAYVVPEVADDDAQGRLF